METNLSLKALFESNQEKLAEKLSQFVLPKDAVNVPSTLGEVFDKLDNEIWESVKVNALEYDEMNRIVKISMSIKEL